MNKNKIKSSVNPTTEAKKVQIIAETIPLDIFTSPLWAGAIVWFFSGSIREFGEVPLETLLTWLGLHVAWSIFAGFLWLAYSRRDKRTGSTHFWARCFIALYALDGSIWGLSCWMLWIDGLPANNMMLTCIMLGASISYTIQLSPHLGTFLAATISLQFIGIARYITDTTGIGTAMSFFGPAFFLWMLMNGYKISNRFSESFDTRAKNREMADHLGAMHGSLEAQVANRTEQLERELEWRKEAQYQLVVAKELAESANKAKTAFLSSMSHELRTPLNAVLGFGQLLEVDPLISKKPKHKTGIEQILKSGHHLLSLIDDVLDLSKIEDDNLTLSIENIAPDQALKDCLNIVLSLADEYQVTLVNKTVDQSLPVVKADYTRFKQVIINLLSNAIKYSGSQSMVSMIAAKSGDNYLRITVTDNGPGIAPDQQKNIFEPFDRLGAESSEIEGTGIGLTIVKQLMEAMDGSVGFESSLDTGSIFWVDFPISEPARV